MTERRSPSFLSRRDLLGAALGLAVGPTFANRARAASASNPVLYVSHGSPLFLPGNERRILEVRAWGRTLAKPRAIVVMTPHYASRKITLGRTATGFAMYDLPRAFKRLLPQNLEYATPPSEAVAGRVESLLEPAYAVTRDEYRRGFDHTTWMPLSCLFPSADVPVLEVSYPYVDDANLLRLGARLSPLRAEGVTFVASGGMTHNLASFDGVGSPLDRAAPPWAQEFDAWATERITQFDVDALVDWREKAPASDLAHPDDGAHFRVFLVALGLALGGADTAQSVRFPITGFEGALSKRSVELR
jgi:4,5-DOPA dioxygenase extradiol